MRHTPLVFLAILLAACGGQVAAPLPQKKASPNPPAPTSSELANLPAPKQTRRPPIDLSRKAARTHDVVISLLESQLRPVRVKSLGRQMSSEEAHFLIRLRLKNVHPTRKVDYRPWAGGALRQDATAALRDEHGNNYKLVTFGFASQIVGQQQTTTSLHPRESLDELLVFERPVKAATRLLLTLPAENLGGKGEVHALVPLAKEEKPELP